MGREGEGEGGREGERRDELTCMFIHTCMLYCFVRHKRYR